MSNQTISQLNKITLSKLHRESQRGLVFNSNLRKIIEYVLGIEKVITQNFDVKLVCNRSLFKATLLVKVTLPVFIFILEYP